MVKKIIIGFVIIALIVGTVFFLRPEFIPFSISSITGINVVPKNIQFVRDNVVYLDTNILEFELVNTRASCGTFSIIQQRIKLNDKGYRCSNIPGRCDNGDVMVNCPLRTCDFSIVLPNNLLPGFYDVNADFGIETSQSTFCVKKRHSIQSTIFKVAITGSGYNLVNDECVFVEQTVPDFNTLQECRNEIVISDDGDGDDDVIPPIEPPTDLTFIQRFIKEFLDLIEKIRELFK